MTTFDPHHPGLTGWRTCTGPCGRWRLKLDFSPRRNKYGVHTRVQPICHTCKRSMDRASYRSNLKRSRTKSRVSTRKGRRLAGVPERAPQVLISPTRPDVVPRLPFAKFLAELKAKHGMNVAAGLVGMDPRRVTTIVDGYYQVRRRKGGPHRRLYPVDWIEFDTVDRAIQHYGDPQLLDELYPIAEEEE